MKLWQTRLHWEKFARTDPMWAVLTDPTKAGNRWNADEFFSTGRQEVDAALAHVRQLCPGLRTAQALDFGCGVGRLTQALAEHFAQVTGVDIAEAMLALAREHNRHGDRVHYVHNTSADLAVFADSTFDFVLSVITLQHIAPDYTRRYLAEFVRVLAPGGVALFQIPALAPATKRRRLSLWPPTLAKRLRRAINRSTAVKPVMEMHTLPREEVLAIIQAAGAEPLEVEAHGGAGDDYQSYAYVIRKR
jgi:ubiquinone/menaquinone biosynthesis C-methylase UbiE